MGKLSRVWLAGLAALLLAFVAACGGGGSQTKDSSKKSSDVQKQETEISFYGFQPEISAMSDLMDAMKKHFAGKYKITEHTVDLSTIQQVIQTGILSGEPADIYFQSTQSMDAYVAAGQALDLTPYLLADGGEWKDRFKQNTLKLGMINDKYWNIPISEQSTAIYVNLDLAGELGITVPDNMTWDEFMNINKRVKELDRKIYPLGISPDHIEWFYRNGVLSLGEEAGMLEELAAGEVPATENLFREVLEKSGDVFMNEYAYPGLGAFNSSVDELMVAFTQGRILMYADTYSNYRAVEEVAKKGGFQLGGVGWPAMAAQSPTVGGASGYFIPANAKNPEASVEILKFLTSEEAQNIVAGHGIPPVILNLDFESPALENIMATSYGVYPHEFRTISPEIRTFVREELIQRYSMGEKADRLLNEMEALRQEAMKRK